jgi:hypothetical protein
MPLVEDYKYTVWNDKTLALIRKYSYIFRDVVRVTGVEISPEALAGAMAKENHAWHESGGVKETLKELFPYWGYWSEEKCQCAYDTVEKNALGLRKNTHYWEICDERDRHA